MSRSADEFVDEEKTRAEHPIVRLERQWPLLGRELYTLEETLAYVPHPDQSGPTEQEQLERREHIRETVLAQVHHEEEKYSLDMRHRALLLVKAGRGGEIVGNPSCLKGDGVRLLLPYTGLEGYYAGSEKTSRRPGLTREEILLEEAEIGAEILTTLKKQHIANNTWGEFARLKSMLNGGKMSLEDIRSIYILCGVVVRRLHTRVYQNPEFHMTLSEQMEHIEQLLGELPVRTARERETWQELHTQGETLKRSWRALSEEEREAEKAERRRMEWIRQDRLGEFQRFREETYKRLQETPESDYELEICDSCLKQANIIETINLPQLLARDSYTPTLVKFTEKQLEGYEFIAKLVEIGGDPLARSVLVAA